MAGNSEWSSNQRLLVITRKEVIIGIIIIMSLSLSLSLLVPGVGVADEFTDDSLSAHESELDRISGFYADNVEVFKLVEKRDSMWRQKLEMEVSW